MPQLNLDMKTGFCIMEMLEVLRIKSKMDKYSMKQLQRLREGLEAVRNGDLTVRMQKEREDIFGELANSYNGMVDDLNRLACEVITVSRVAGFEGKLSEIAKVEGVEGTWKDVVDALNTLIISIAMPLNEFSKIVSAISKGDLTKRVSIDVRGDFKALAKTINDMMDSLNILASEVSRVAKEVGIEGKLGVHAVVPNVAGSWKDVVDNLNGLVDALTVQVREISKVIVAISKGDLTQKIEIPTAGEIKALADAINGMVDDLNRLAGEVSRVAKIAGEEGNLSERAKVEGVAGSWKDIVDKLNSLIDAIATPIMEIQRVLVAMSQGDLTQKVTLKKAVGDFKAIGDKINQTLVDLGGLVRRVGVVGERVAAGADQVAVSASQVNTALQQVTEIVEQVSGGAQTQSKRLEEATKVVSDLARSIQQGATNARSAADATTETAQLGVKGTEAGKDATLRLKTIDEVVKVNKETVKKVDESAQEITAIVGTINEIADQTNLLALNAAIEAARAGEAGRGFAVVADEVRKLAERSKTATGEIEALIDEVRKSASGAVSSMVQGAEQIAESTKIVDNALSVLNQITIGAQEISAKAQEISAATQEQSAGTAQVTQTIDEIATISEQNASNAQKMSASIQQQTASMQQMTSSAQELSGLAKELYTAIQRFILEPQPTVEREEAPAKDQSRRSPNGRLKVD